MKLKFTKMQGLGNDFVVIDAIHQDFHPETALVKKLADRRFGIGCDQLLLVEAARQSGTDFHYRIFNADGSEVEQCGNGARCFARFVRDQRLTNRRIIDVGTAAGPIQLRVEADEQVTVNMGAPVLRPEYIPFLAEAQAIRYPLTLADHKLEIGAVSMGNPHAILLVDDIDQAPVDELGPGIERHPAFPRQTNVGFMQIRSPDHIALRVFERGVGETLACGTGACAAVVYGRLLGRLEEKVAVSLPGGELQIRWPGEGQAVWMTGPATPVFDGVITL